MCHYTYQSGEHFSVSGSLVICCMISWRKIFPLYNSKTVVTRLLRDYLEDRRPHVEPERSEGSTECLRSSKMRGSLVTTV